MQLNKAFIFDTRPEADAFRVDGSVEIDTQIKKWPELQVVPVGSQFGLAAVDPETRKIIGLIGPSSQ